MHNLPSTDPLRHFPLPKWAPLKVPTPLGRKFAYAGGWELILEGIPKLYTLMFFLWKEKQILGEIFLVVEIWHILSNNLDYLIVS